MRSGVVLTVALLAASAGPAHAAGSADVAALQVALRGVGLYQQADRRVGRSRDTRGRAPFPGRQGLDRRRGRGCGDQGGAGPARRPVVRHTHDQPRATPAGTWPRSSSGSRGAASRRAPSTAASAATWRRRCDASRRIRGLTADGTAGPQTLRLLRGRDTALADLAQGTRSSARSVTASGRAGTASTPGSTTPLPRGALVAAAGRGQVVFAGWDSSGYGNTVVIEHPLGVRSLYAHLSRIGVSRGTAVVAGSTVGRVGTDGSLDRPAPALRGAPARRGGRSADRAAAVGAGVLQTR